MALCITDCPPMETPQRDVATEAIKDRCYHSVGEKQIDVP